MQTLSHTKKNPKVEDQNLDSNPSHAANLLCVIELIPSSLGFSVFICPGEDGLYPRISKLSSVFWLNNSLTPEPALPHCELGPDWLLLGG